MTFAVAANEKGEKVLTMNKEYIEREKAIEWFMAFVHMGESDIPAETVISDLKYAIPAADVAPVVQGRWQSYESSRYVGVDGKGNPKYRNIRIYYCSQCGHCSIIRTKG